MRFRLKRVLGATAAIGLAATLVPIVAGPADATPGAQPPTAIAPFPVATRTTPFSLTNSVTCDGTGAAGWRAHTFIVNTGVDPSTLDFTVSGAPAGYVGVDFDSSNGSIAAPLYKGSEDAGANFLPATSPAGFIAGANFSGFTFDPSVWTLTDGDYQIGIACVDGPGVVKQWWTRTVHIDANATPLAFMTEPVPEPEATPVGSCTDMKALGTLKSSSLSGDGKPSGITDQNDKDVAISLKGVDPAVQKPAIGTANVGTCTYEPGLSTPDGGKPVVKGFNGTKVIDKWTAKLSSPEADCNPADADATEWPLSGSFMVTYRTTGLKQTISVIAENNTDPDDNPATPSDLFEFRGIVTKGVAVGADVSGSMYFDPVVKDKLQTTANPYFGYTYDATGGCDNPEVAADVRTVLMGDGTGVLGIPASGLSFTIGG